MGLLVQRLQLDRHILLWFIAVDCSRIRTPNRDSITRDSTHHCGFRASLHVDQSIGLASSLPGNGLLYQADYRDNLRYPLVYPYLLLRAFIHRLLALHAPIQCASRSK